MNISEPTFVFVAYGSVGDIYPLLEVARCMAAEGRQVVFVANEYFGDIARNAGVEFIQAGTREEQLAARETKDSNGDTFEGAMVRYDFLIGRNYQRVTAIIEKLLSTARRLMVITHGRLSPAFPVCEQHDIPIVLTYYSPAQIPDNQEDYVLYRSSFGGNEWLARHVFYPMHKIKKRIHRSPVGRYNYWRRQGGYAQVRNPITTALLEGIKGRGFSVRFRHRNVIGEIALFPEWFAEPMGEDIRHIRYAGFVFHTGDNARNNQIVDEFIKEHGSPIVFTPGTAVEDIDAFCAPIAETCRMLDAPAIVLSRHMTETSQSYNFDLTGAHVLALDHVDLGYVLPKSRLLVHHGGIGTLAQAVRAGIPQVIRPRMYDQPGNALRVAQNGLGGMLYDDGYTAAGIVSIYRYLIESQTHMDCLSHYRDQVRNQNSTREVIASIEAWAVKHFSVVDQHQVTLSSDLMDVVS